MHDEGQDREQGWKWDRRGDRDGKGYGHEDGEGNRDRKVDRHRVGSGMRVETGI